MKKITALLLVLIFVLTLAACGGSSGGNEPAQSGSTESSGSVKKESSSPEPTKADTAAYSLEEAVIVDDDNCVFSITGVEDSMLSVEFNVYCENKTEKTLMFSWNNVTVNGCMSDPFWATEVAAGKKLNGSISFYKSNLSSYGLLPIDELQFDLTVYDSEDWIADRLVDERFTVYPTGLSADTVVYPERQTTEDEQILFVDESSCFVILGADPDSLFGYSVHVYLENKTDANMMFSWDDVSVNGYMCDPFWGSTVAPHSCAYTDVTFFSTTLSNSGIETVEEIEFRLTVHDADNWLSDRLVDQVFTYTP